ncbi:MAG: DUF3343 domain-containing protein [Clostridia bacterium]|nr:DUF3343 domain-containing protein [Clostridia bacterium]
MQSFTIYCPSVTSAQRGQRLLEKEAIPSRLSRGTKNGCTWGLEIPSDKRREALALLEAGGVVYSF